METDWVILADRAEIINNKLYLMGGGWDRLTLNQSEMTHIFGVAAAFSVPWNETNQVQAVEIVVTDEDNSHELAKVAADIEVGRPAGIRPGQSQRIQMGLNIGVTFNDFGGHVVIVRIEGIDDRRFAFEVDSGPALPQVR